MAELPDVPELSVAWLKEPAGFSFLSFPALIQGFRYQTYNEYPNNVLAVARKKY